MNEPEIEAESRFLLYDINVTLSEFVLQIKTKQVVCSVQQKLVRDSFSQSVTQQDVLVLKR